MLRDLGLRPAAAFGSRLRLATRPPEAYPAPPQHGLEDCSMPKTKQASPRKRLKEVVPALGLVGVSLSLASASAAAVVGPESDIPFKDTATGPGIMLSEEEISDVSLGTFYVFDKETPKLGEQYAQRRGCGGCRGCRGGRGCGRGCGGCGGGCGGCGCCLSWGRCAIC